MLECSSDLVDRNQTTSKCKADLPIPVTTVSGHRHSLPLQNKINEVHLKCSCALGNTEAKPSIEKSILERKQNVLAAAEDNKPSKVVRSRKEKRDAATSPQLPNRNGLNTDTVSPCHTSAVIARPSPRREIPMRNAATSPQRDDRKTNVVTKSASPTVMVVDSKPATPKPLKNPITSKIILEKSKSLSDSPPSRQLRTTRSLSPRPPVRHQQAIIISDENDIVLKVTPSEYFDDDDEVFAHEDNLKIRQRAKGKAQSENTSPNLSNYSGTFFAADDRYANNRSTGCLVYVPSDPWMKQSDKEATGRAIHNARSATLKEKSANYKSLANDPWIYRRADNSTGNQAKQALAWLSRQSKSMSSNIDEGPTTSCARPKLQRSKTPATFDDPITDINNGYKNHHQQQQQFRKDNQYNADKIANHTPHNVALPFSPQRTPLPSPPPPPSTSCATNKSNGDNQKRAQNFLLNVVNPNMLQPRHSFSTLLPQKEDELQLNIRRLSEQIKSPIGYAGLVGGGSGNSADFSTYLSQMKQTQPLLSSVPNIVTAKQQSSTKGSSSICIEADIVLETTC